MGVALGAGVGVSDGVLVGTRAAVGGQGVEVAVGGAVAGAAGTRKVGGGVRPEQADRSASTKRKKAVLFIVLDYRRN